MQTTAVKPEPKDRFALPGTKAMAFYGIVLLSIGVIFVFSQMGTCLGDEGFHLLAAQLVMHGKKPYIDFFYQHPPLYIYITAGWMSVFGDTWRSAHALAALFTSGCVVLVASYLYDRWRTQTQGVATALTATLILALNYSFVGFGTIGHPYAFCLFFSIASFRLTVRAKQTRGYLVPLLAGLCAGASIASSLLTLPIAPVLLGWLLWHNSRGNRLRKALFFFCGTLLPFAPLIFLFMQGPRQVVLDVIQYHLFYRASGSVTPSLFGNLKTLINVITNSPGPLVLLAALGSLRLLKRAGFGNPDLRAEFQLSLFLLASLGIYLSLPLPTFAAYYVLSLPFVVILASAGIHLVYTMATFGRLRALIIAVIILTGTNLRAVYGGMRGASSCWQSSENTAMAIDRVTPRNGVIYADEKLYFLTRHMPAPGLENLFGTENLPTALAPISHVAPPARVDDWLGSGYFDSVLVEVNDPRIERLGLLQKYPNVQKVQLYNLTYYLMSKR